VIKVKVGVKVGNRVSVGVGVSVAVGVAVGVGVSVGVGVGVAVGCKRVSTTRFSIVTGSCSAVNGLSGPTITRRNVTGPE
jgi:hypothetical protein